MVNDPVAVVRLDIGHGAALLDRNGDAVRQGARDLCFVHIGKLAEDAAGRREAVDEKEVVTLADARGVNDLLGRVDGVSDDLDLRDGRALGAKPGHEHGRAAAQVTCRERRAGEPLDAGDIRHTALDTDGCAQTPEFLGMTVAVGKDVFGEHRGALCPQAGRHERRLRIRGKARIRLRDDRARRRELSIR